MRSIRYTVLLGAALGVAGLHGCGQKPPAAEAPPPPALAYGVPALSPATFTVADTATFRVHAGAMGDMHVTSAYDGTAEVTAAPDDDGFTAAVTFPQFSGSLQTQANGGVTVDERGIAGAFTVTVGPRGPISVVDRPALSPELLDVVGAESLVRPLFVQLPDRAVTPGDSWVDTVTSVEESEGSRTEATTVITSTLAGDTLVGDRRLLLFRTRAENRIEMNGVSGGTQVQQLLTGVTEGTVIWDDQLNLLVERREDGELAGTLAMPAAGVEGMPISARVRRSVVWIGAPLDGTP